MSAAPNVQSNYRVCTCAHIYGVHRDGVCSVCACGSFVATPFLDMEWRREVAERAYSALCAKWGTTRDALSWLLGWLSAEQLQAMLDDLQTVEGP